MTALLPPTWSGATLALLLAAHALADFAEYYLVGTLASVVVAVASGLAVRALV